MSHPIGAGRVLIGGALKTLTTSTINASLLAVCAQMYTCYMYNAVFCTKIVKQKKTIFHEYNPTSSVASLSHHDL